MSQYIAKLMFNIHIEKENTIAQFDEQIRLIESQSFETAFQKARSLGQKEETNFLNSENNTVSWKFIDVVDLFALQELRDGEQLFSITHEAQNVNSYIDYIRKKSMAVQLKSLTFG